MKLLHTIVLLSGFGLSATLQAATEFENNLVPIELAEQLLGGAIYKSLPDDFPVAALPSDLGLSVIGSVNRSPMYQQVLFRSASRPGVLRDAIRQAYIARGWIDLSSINTRLSLCHNQWGTLHFQAAGGNTFRIDRTMMPSIPSPMVALTCTQQREFQQSWDETRSYIMSLMPILEVPEAAVVSPSPTQPRFIRSTGFSGFGSSFEMNQEGSIEVPDSSVADLYQHFARQLEAQGWEGDSAGVGERSASSVWFKVAQQSETGETPAQDINLTGTLTLLMEEHSAYQVLFRLQSNGGIRYNYLPSIGIRGLPSVNSFLPVRDAPFVVQPAS